MAEATGISFDRTPSGVIRAPAGQIRVCAWHVDHDEHPVCTVDVDSIAEAAHIGEHLSAALGGWNADFITAYNADGDVVGSTCPWGLKAFEEP